MQWVGKAVGGIVGFAAAGPVGSLLGILVGHQFDQGLGQRITTGSSPSIGSQKIQRLFFETSFSVMGHIAKADGRVSEEDVRAARRVMHAMRLTPEQVREAIDHFTAGKQPNFPLAARIADLCERIGDRRDLTRAFVEIQMQALVASGAIGKSQRELLWEVASGLGIGRVELAQIEALVRAQAHRASGQRREQASLEEAFQVLGVAPDAADEEIKTAYRRLMNQHHPDKLVARGLPESMTAVAEEKTHKIRAAYERIKTERDFK